MAETKDNEEKKMFEMNRCQSQETWTGNRWLLLVLKRNMSKGGLNARLYLVAGIKTGHGNVPASPR